MTPFFLLLICSYLCLAEITHFAKPSFIDGRYYNPPSFKNWTGVPGFFKIVKVFFTEKNMGQIPDQEMLNSTLPVRELTMFTGDTELYASWLGHSTVLVHMEGATFLTDPIWAERASPVPVGGKRYRPSPMKIENLPKLDFAMISHDHYDHLDRTSVLEIHARQPNITWFVPMGMKEWLQEEGLQSATIVEMNWGENSSITVNQKTFTVWCTPAQHWGQRKPWDRNKRLWSGFAVLGPKKRFYYSGDTGFCRNEFEKIGQKLGPFDLSAIPIGCFEPAWFMKSQHIGPVEAVEIHKLVGSNMTIGVHWGTYEMGSYENYLEPKRLLNRLMEKEKREGRRSQFVTLEPGSIWREH